MTKAKPLFIDPIRYSMPRVVVDYPKELVDAGIEVRANRTDGPTITDLSSLSRESLIRWLEAAPTRATMVVLLLMGHPQLPPRDQLPTLPYDLDPHKRQSPGSMRIPTMPPPSDSRNTPTPPSSRKLPQPRLRSERMFPPPESDDER